MSVAPAFREYPLAHYVWKLLRLGWLISFNGFRRATRARQLGYVLVGVAVAAIIVLAFLGSWALLDFLNSPEWAMLVDPKPFLSSLPVLVATFAFIGTLLFSFGMLLQALYLAGDMDFLLCAPVPIRAVFLSKLLQAILPNFGLICLLGLPVLYGLGAAEQYSWWYYPLVVIILAALVLAAAGLASLLVMGVVRVFPARRVAEVLGLVGGVLWLVLSQTGQFTNSTGFLRNQAPRAFDLMARLDAPWFPPAWAGRGLVDIGEGHWLSGAGFLLLSLGLSALVFGAALVTAERLYYTGWARMQVGVRRRRNAVAAPPRAARRSTLITRMEESIPAAVRGLVGKDALVLRRDLRQLSQVISPLLLGVLYAVLFLRGGGAVPAGRGEAPAWFMQTLKNFIGYANIGFALFVGWSLMTRLALMGFSQEGKYYWLIKTAPVSAAQLVASKFLVAYVPTLAIGWAFLLTISLLQRADPGLALFGLPVVALCLAGGVGISLTFGIVSANLEWQDPHRMLSGVGGCAALLATGGYMALVLILFFGPALGLSILGWPDAPGRLAGLLLGGIASLMFVFIPLSRVLDRVSHIGEK